MTHTPRTIGDVVRHVASLHGDKIALVGEDGGETSYRACAERVARLACGLLRHGLARGERVAILSKNRPEFIETIFAASSIGAPVPLNWRLTADDILFILRDSAPRVIFADANHVALIDELRPRIGFAHVFVCYDGARRGWLAYDAMLAIAGDGPPDPQPEDTACVIYTSGTTGRPKGAELTHAGLLRNCAMGRDHVMKLGADDITLALMPLFHVGGLWYHFFPSFSAGNTIHIQSAFDPVAALHAIHARRITNMHVVPTMLHALLQKQAELNLDLSSLRLILYAASSIPPSLLRRAMETLSGCDFLQSYGSTESGFITAFTPAQHREALRNSTFEHRLNSCGRPLEDMAVRIAPLPGSADPSVGEIEVRSPMSMRGYLGAPEFARSAFNGEWLRMGDIGTIDADGFLTILDRKNDMIVTGGENVFPRDVEDILLDMPGVLEAAVFDLPDERWVQRVAAAIVVAPGAEHTPDAVASYARGRMAGFKLPKSIFIVDALPRNAAGKVLRKALRERFKTS